MTNRIGIYKIENNFSYYSSEWKDADNFPEKEMLRSLSEIMCNGKKNFFIDIVKSGDKVVIKPNWVLDRNLNGQDLYSVITHPSILRATVDLVYEAMHGEGEIIISDASQWDCDFDKLMETTEVYRICEYYWKKYKYEIPILDLREVSCPSHDGAIRPTDLKKLEGDPRGYSTVDLGDDSALEELTAFDRLYGSSDDRWEIMDHHGSGTHEYRVSNTVLESDVLISVPKLKVHKKVGVTLNAKGMVGINGNKNWLPHFRCGSPKSGGDEFPDIESCKAKTISKIRRSLIDHLLYGNSVYREKLFYKIQEFYRRVKPKLNKAGPVKTIVNGGNWYGNDTAWRMTADLSRIALYSDKNGNMKDKPQRRFFSIIDGIVGGEKNGPLSPIPKYAGVILAGKDLVAVDIVGTRLMGFQWQKIQYLSWLVNQKKEAGLDLDPQKHIIICTNKNDWENLFISSNHHNLEFEPHPGWKGKIEINF